MRHGDVTGVLAPWDDPAIGFFHPSHMAYKIVTDPAADASDGTAFYASSAVVERSVVPVGTEVLLRLDCPHVARALLARPGAHLLSADRHRRKWSDAAGAAEGTVLPAMLLYQLPVRAEDTLGPGLWVGVRRRLRGALGNTYHAHFFAVAPGMLFAGDAANAQRYEWS